MGETNKNAAAANQAAVAAAAGHMPMMGMMPGMMMGIPHAPAPAPTSKRNADGPPARYKKAPDAPKRFKSAFIIFSAEKHKEIKEQHAKEGRTEKTTDIAKLVSEAWRELSPEDKEVWEKKARKDKARYEVEKAMYKGPWKIPANKRTPKDPSAPKRPMSAFLAYSNKRRAGLKRENPNATNADLSKMLSKKWKEEAPEVKKQYTDEEAELRSNYKIEMGKWRKKVAEEKKAERKEREALAMQAAEARAQGVPPEQLGLPPMGDGTDGGAAAAMMGPMFGMYPHQGGEGGQQMPPGFNPAMLGNPYAHAMGLNPGAAMQLQISQLLGQQFMQNSSMGQRGALGLYGQGLPNQGGSGQASGGQGGGSGEGNGSGDNPALAGFAGEGGSDSVKQE